MGGGGGTRSGKVYRLRSNRCRAVAVMTRKLKRGAVLLLCCRIGEVSQSF